MKQVSRLLVALLLLLGALLSRPARVQAYDLTCSDCIRLCFLQNCGFVSDPACEEAVYPDCQLQCASYCG
jgi:hypothetical protein